MSNQNERENEGITGPALIVYDTDATQRTATLYFGSIRGVDRTHMYFSSAVKFGFNNRDPGAYLALDCIVGNNTWYSGNETFRVSLRTIRESKEGLALLRDGITIIEKFKFETEKVKNYDLSDNSKKTIEEIQSEK